MVDCKNTLEIVYQVTAINKSGKIAMPFLLMISGCPHFLTFSVDIEGLALRLDFVATDVAVLAAVVVLRLQSHHLQQKLFLS